MEGYEKGEQCNRNGCKGILEEHDTDYGCSCHMGNPPCSYCVNCRSYCEECDWDGYEEQNESNLDRIKRERNQLINKILYE